MTRLRQESSDWSTQSRVLRAELEKEREERETQREERERERETEREEREREREEKTAEVQKITEHYQKESQVIIRLLFSSHSHFQLSHLGPFILCIYLLVGQNIFMNCT